MYFCFSDVASKVWKKSCPNFSYRMYKVGRKLESSFSHSFLVIFPSLVMWQISLFFKHVCLFVCLFVCLNAYAFLVFFNQVPHMQVADMIQGVNTISGKVSVVTVNRAGGSAVLRDPSGGFRVWILLRKFLGSK